MRRGWGSRARFASVVVAGLITLMLILNSTSNRPSPVFAQAPSVNRTVIPSPYVTEFAVPDSNAGPYGIVVDSRGSVWFMDINSSSIYLFRPANRTFTRYQYQVEKVSTLGTTGAAGGQLAYADDGRIWFTEADANAIGVLDPVTGQFEFYTLRVPNAGPFDIKVAKDGSIWFTELFANRIARLDPISKRRVEYSLPSERAGPAMLAFDADGKIWFSEAFGSKIGLFDPSLGQEGTSNGMHKFTPPYELASPVGIAVADEVIWVADHGGSSFSMFVPSANTWQQFWVSPPPPEADSPESLTNDLAIDTQGHIWLAEHVGNRMARFDPVTQLLTEYELPTRPLSITLWLALDPVGNVWFTQWAVGQIGVVNATTKPRFTVAATSGVLLLAPEGKTSVEISVAVVDASPSPLTLSVMGMTTTGPRNLSYEFTPSVIRATERGNSVTNLTLKAQPSLEAGRYLMMVRASDPTIIQSAVVELIVQPGRTATGGVEVLYVAVPVAVAATVGGAALLYRHHKRIQTGRASGMHPPSKT